MVALVAAFVTLLAWDLWRIRTELEAGREALDGLTLDAAATVGLTELAEDAAGHLDTAADRAHGSLPLKVLRVLPVLGDQIDGIRRMADVTADLGRSGATAARHVDQELQHAGEPAGRVALLDAALGEVDRIAAELQDVELGRPDSLLPPLRKAHDELADSIVHARKKLEDARRQLTPVRDLLMGPSSFLLLAANNAEMAGGAGLALSAGLLTFDHGEIELGEVVQAGDLRLDHSVPVPGDLAAIYQPTGVGIDLRSTTRSPNLPLMGPVAAAMMAEHGLVDLDGVLVVDAVALADVMRVSGGVEVGGEAVDASTVLAKVLHDNYLRYQTGDEREERVSLQGEIAKAVFQSLTEHEVPAARLADALLTASEGRHLLLWAANPELQAVWEVLGLSGSLDERGLLVSYQNYGADKMDWYLRPTTSMHVVVLPSGDYRARLTMRVEVPPLAEVADASPYILGPSPGTHAVFLTVHLPAAAYDISTPDGSGFTSGGIDPPLQVRTFLEDIPAGTTFERRLDFSIPRELSSLVLLPSARMEPMPFTIDDVVTLPDDRPRTIRWLASLPGPSPVDDVSPWVHAVTVLGLVATFLATTSTAVEVTRQRRGQPTATGPRAARRAALCAMACFAFAGLLAFVLSAPRV